jgi:hypothetical protein
MRGKLDKPKGNRMRRSYLNLVVALVTATAASLAILSLVAPGAALAGNQHQSLLRIGAGAPGTSQPITLGLNTSMIIELPRPCATSWSRTRSRSMRCCNPPRALI